MHFILFSERNGKKTGLLQANPLNSSFLENSLYTPSSELEQFRDKGYDPAKILYISCFLMAKEEHSNLEAINLLFERAVEEAQRMGKSQICYMEVVEDKNHSLRPVPFMPLEPWEKVQKKFRKTNIFMEMSWPTLQADGKVNEENHQMEFFILD